MNVLTLINLIQFTLNNNNFNGTIFVLVKVFIQYFSQIKSTFKLGIKKIIKVGFSKDLLNSGEMSSIFIHSESFCIYYPI